MKRIALSQGLTAFVDDDDYIHLMTYNKWFAVKHHGTLYAKTNIPAPEGKRTTMKMHRVIMNAQPGDIVDHINGNGLDNRKENLRIVSNKHNARNRKSHSGTSSIYKGVSYLARLQKWQVNICEDGVNHYIGVYASEEQAARAYDRHAIIRFGQFARLNFPPPNVTNKTSAAQRAERY